MHYPCLCSYSLLVKNLTPQLSNETIETNLIVKLHFKCSHPRKEFKLENNHMKKPLVESLVEFQSTEN